MGEIIEFPGVHKRPPAIEIPSLNDLYNEEAIIVDGRKACDLKAHMIKAQKLQALENFESALANARGEYILKCVRNPQARRNALIGLARFTYSVGYDIGSIYLMDWARDELISAFGVAKAAVIIENVKLEKELAKRTEK
jgi:hypothetical protein